MSRIEELRQLLPAAAKDQKLNIQAVLRGDSLGVEQCWAIAYASALFIGADDRFVDALLEDGKGAGLTDELIDDAKAAVAIMRMNTVYYRFKHMVEKESYSSMPAKLRMGRMASPVSGKANFELLSMACAALAGCSVCIQSHEASLLAEGVSEQQVHDCVRIASVVAGFDAGLRMAEPVVL